MKRFNDIKQEVCEPVRHYQPDCPLDAKQDAFMRMYRNFWGAYTDTQIRMLNSTDYIITGRYCNEPRAMETVFFGKVIGHNLVVPVEFNSLLSDLGLCAEYVRYNGQVAIRLRPRNDEESVIQLSDRALLHDPMPDVTDCGCFKNE